MNIKAKMILSSPWLFLKTLKVLRQSRVYRNNPSMYDQDMRMDFMVKRAKWILKFLKIDLEVVGYDKLPKQSAILYPNHVSNLDPVILVAALAKQTKDKSVNHKSCTFLAKQELEDNFITRKVLYILDTMYLNRQNLRESLATMESFGQLIRDQRNLGIIFPEGTRAKSDQLLEFKAGAFKVAKTNFYPIIPVTINGSGQALNPKRSKRIKVQVIFHDAVDSLKIQQAETAQIAQMTQKIVASEYQNQEVYSSPKQKTRNPKRLTYSQKRAKKEAKLEAKARKYEDF
ncbi:lysophospholipid acyltransferase family protein [[Mycoplasma] gypis]|uniref:Lysophospholipid acyltransferase family protein n=1 Tax=[Mycoplasma] gypis TaxID=92404 RepID=A0ABZ2RNU1_9BACT|nr:lysophospholipid acyltransferase family protein [[Mycoplasma] gypis]MBN0919257.1 1-acyl-sn-glycerol-3-phosphate acyltransferase [[Mycoplasma] gypis]